MKQVLIKNFTLRQNGMDYTAGSVVSVDDDTATQLVMQAPKEFEIVANDKKNVPAQSTKEQPKTKEHKKIVQAHEPDGLPDVDPAENVQL